MNKPTKLEEAALRWAKAAAHEEATCRARRPIVVPWSGKADWPDWRQSQDELREAEKACLAAARALLPKGER